MTVEEKIIQELKDFPGLDDDELASRLSNDRHYINYRCNMLAKKGIILREKNHLKNGKYCNYILKNVLPSQAQSHSNSLDHAELQEEDVKHIINNWLISNGWETTVAWGYPHGVDIEAKMNGEHWLIEVKGPCSRNEMRVNYFIGILGETLQRMQPMYWMHDAIGRDGTLRCRTNAYISGGVVDVGADVFARGCCLPSDNKMTAEQQTRVVEVIHRCFE